MKTDSPRSLCSVSGTEALNVVKASLHHDVDDKHKQTTTTITRAYVHGRTSEEGAGEGMNGERR